MTRIKKAEPGTITDVQKEGFVVATGNDTSILITELQPSGKKKMLVKDYLSGAGSFVQIGMKVGTLKQTKKSVRDIALDILESVEKINPIVTYY